MDEHGSQAPGLIGVPIQPIAPRVNPTAHEAWRELLCAQALISREAERRLREADLPPLAWHEVLLALEQAPNQRLRHGALADDVVLSRSGLSRLVDRMVSADLISREPHADDRRGADISLTAAGGEMLTRTSAIYAEVVEQRFARPLGIYASGVRDALGAVVRPLRGASGKE